MDIQTIYQDTIKYAAAKHAAVGQKVPGTDLPYVVHLSNVAMEIIIAGFNTKDFDLSLGIQTALLHDTIEDTETDYKELHERFGSNVANSVLALTKNKDLPSEQQMQDSLARIKLLQREVWAVKLADRITNLQIPPAHWDNAKKIKYQEEARIILNALRSANEYLALSLESTIENYSQYLSV